MKKISLMIILMFSCFILQAPVIKYEDKTEQWKQAEELWYWQPLIDAVVWVESSGDTFAYNEKEGAVGAFQIRQIRVTHYNKLIGSNYKLEDFFDYDLSREMFLYFAKNKDYEKASRNWNGSGPKTKIYWNKVKQNL